MSRTHALLLAVILACARPAAAQDFYFGHWLRDLPAGGNLFAFLESTQPEITTDRFNSGGLNAGEPERASAFLASWSQTEYRIDDVSISSPVDGTPMLFPELAWWNRIDVATGVMPAWTSATGLAISLEPQAVTERWTGSVELSGSGGALAQGSSASRPPAIARLDASTQATALVGGQLMNRKLGLLIGAAWTRASVTERSRSSDRNETGSAFARATYAASPLRTLRAVLWAQPDRFHAQVALDVKERWRWFAGYTRRSTTSDRPSSGRIEADRLIDGPMPLLIGRGGDESRLIGGAQLAVKTSRHAATFRGEVERTSFRAATPFAGAIAESVDGIPARVWHYSNPGVDSHRNAVLIAALAQDRISLSPRAAVDASLRFDLADARADGATQGIRWNTWLPSAHLHLDFGTALHLRFVTGIARMADQLRLGLLAHGDPAAATADIYRWEGGPLSGAPLVGRAGPGAGGSSQFSQIDPRLRRPVTDQFAIGLESTPLSSLRVTVTGLARRQSSSIAVVNTGVPVSGYSTFTIADANADWVNPKDDQQLPVYNRKPETFGQDRYLLTNPGAEAATMGAVVVSAEVVKPRVVFRIGGTASASVGSGGNRGFTAIENDQAIAGELFTNPNAGTYARGRLFNDRAYTIKSMAIFRLPSELRIGVLARFQDGQPFSRLAVVTGLNQGVEAIQAFPRGRSRFSFRATLDLRLQKGVAAGAVRFDVIANAYNLLNMSTEVEEYVVTGPRFREITAVQPPRSFHLGARVSF